MQSIQKKRRLQSNYLHLVVVTFTLTRKIQEYQVELGDKREKRKHSRLESVELFYIQHSVYNPVQVKG